MSYPKINVIRRYTANVTNHKDFPDGTYTLEDWERPDGSVTYGFIVSGRHEDRKMEGTAYVHG